GLGRAVPPAVAAEEPSARRDRARSRRFQAALGGLFAAPRLADQLASRDTLVCRCEEVTLRAVEASFDEGAGELGAVKRVTRAGMGRCQGRYCAPVLADLWARRSGLPLAEEQWFAPAPPFKPIPVAAAVEAIAALDLPEGAPGGTGRRSIPGAARRGSRAAILPRYGRQVKPRNGKRATTNPGSSSPIAGRSSGSPGQTPCHVRSNELPASAGTTSTARRRFSASPGKSVARRPLARSILASQPPPIRIVPRRACFSVRRPPAKEPRWSTSGG